MAACERVPANTRRFGLHEGIPVRKNAERLQNFVNFRGNVCLNFFNFLNILLYIKNRLMLMQVIFK